MHRRSLAVRRSGLVGVVLLMAVSVLTTAAGSAGAADWNDRLVLDVGHVDAVHVTLEDGRLAVRLREDVTGSHVVHDADDVVLQVTNAARFAVPDVPGFEFLGPVGASTWLIPEVQNPDVVWAGWDTEEIEHGQLQDDAVTLELTEATGPGTVHIFNNGPVGEALMVFDPQTGLRTHTVPVNAHVHADWAFSAPGLYELTFKASGVTAAGVLVEGSASYQFVVGDLPGSTDPSPTPTDPSPSDPPVTGGSVTQSIRAQIADGNGGLVVSVDPQDRSVVLPPAMLASSGGYWAASGELRPVTVTDTRSGSPGWNVVGRVGAFSGSAGEFSGKYLGWTPQVADQSADQAVVAGAPVVPGLRSGEGLARSSTLGSAAAGSGRGVAVLGAGLELNVPTVTEAGSYEATLTLTVI